MIKLKDILLESTVPNIFIPRRIEDRQIRYINYIIRQYIKNGSEDGLDISGLGLRELPSILNDITINGYFDCSGRSENVSGYNSFGRNQLKSLKNAPKVVKGMCYFMSLGLETLEGGPEYVSGDFECSYNNLKTLKGAPKFVGRNFYCNDNGVKFTEEQVRAVCNVRGTVFVSVFV